jgi:perosamine synthetase
MDPAFIPYGRQQILAEDIEAVIAVLQSDWLTTGPMVERFEVAVAQATATAHGVAVCNGTAALHAAMHAIGIGPGDEVIVPPMTFAATANAVLYQGGTPVFADVELDTLLIDPAAVAAKITPRTKAIAAVDYAGQACDYSKLRDIASKHGLHLLADACHSLGGSQHGAPCGSQADLSVLSFHPVKPITTGEGGMIVTDDAELARRLRLFRNHGITTDHRQRSAIGAWRYDMVELGYNYRLSDIHCALGVSQLKRLGSFIERRQELAARYDAAFAGLDTIRPLARRWGNYHGFHLYVVRVPQRDRVHARLREMGVGANVHYTPVHLHPYYRQHLGTGEGLCPVAETAYSEILSLPIFPDLSEVEQERVIAALLEAVS